MNAMTTNSKAGINAKTRRPRRAEKFRQDPAAALRFLESPTYERLMAAMDELIGMLKRKEGNLEPQISQITQILKRGGYGGRGVS